MALGALRLWIDGGGVERPMKASLAISVQRLELPTVNRASSGRVVDAVREWSRIYHSLWYSDCTNIPPLGPQSPDMGATTERSSVTARRQLGQLLPVQMRRPLSSQILTGLSSRVVRCSCRALMDIGWMLTRSTSRSSGSERTTAAATADLCVVSIIFYSTISEA